VSLIIPTGCAARRTWRLVVRVMRLHSWSRSLGGRVPAAALRAARHSRAIAAAGDGLAGLPAGNLEVASSL
jgi:hypothetical protein